MFGHPWRSASVRNGELTRCDRTDDRPSSTEAARALASLFAGLQSGNPLPLAFPPNSDSAMTSASMSTSSSSPSTGDFNGDVTLGSEAANARPSDDLMRLFNAFSASQMANVPAQSHTMELFTTVPGLAPTPYYASGGSATMLPPPPRPSTSTYTPLPTRSGRVPQLPDPEGAEGDRQMTLFNQYFDLDWPSEDEDDDPDFRPASDIQVDTDLFAPSVSNDDGGETDYSVATNGEETWNQPGSYPFASSHDILVAEAAAAAALHPIASTSTLPHASTFLPVNSPLIASTSSNPPSVPVLPVKRGRGRPRKIRDGETAPPPNTKPKKAVASKRARIELSPVAETPVPPSSSHRLPVYRVPTPDLPLPPQPAKKPRTSTGGRPKPLTADEKKRQRMERNRQTAAASRERKRAQEQEVERERASLERERDLLRERVGELEDLVASYRATLEGIVARDGPGAGGWSAGLLDHRPTSASRALEEFAEEAERERDVTPPVVMEKSTKPLTHSALRSSSRKTNKADEDPRRKASSKTSAMRPSSTAGSDDDGNLDQSSIEADDRDDHEAEEAPEDPSSEEEQSSEEEPSSSEGEDEQEGEDDLLQNETASSPVAPFDLVAATASLSQEGLAQLERLLKWAKEGHAAGGTPRSVVA